MRLVCGLALGIIFWALSRNSMKWSFHAALVKTTNSVLAAAIF